MVIDPRLLRNAMNKRPTPTGPVVAELRDAEHQERQRALSERAAQKRLTGGLLMRGPSAVLELPESELMTLSLAGRSLRIGIVALAGWSLGFMVFIFHQVMWSGGESIPRLEINAAVGAIASLSWAVGVSILLRPAKRARDGLPVRTGTLRDCMSGRSTRMLFIVRASQWIWPVAWMLTGFTELSIGARGSGPIHADVTLLLFLAATTGFIATLLILRDVAAVLADSEAQEWLWWGVGVLPIVSLMLIAMILVAKLWSATTLAPVMYVVGLLAILLVVSVAVPCIGGVWSLGTSCMWAIRVRRNRDGISDKFRERWFGVEAAAAEQRKQDSVARWED